MPAGPRFPWFLLLLVSALPALAGNRHWTIDGPFGGGISTLAYDPADASIAYAAGANGIFRSSDGGRHWTAAPDLLGVPAEGLAVAASNPDIVYAASGLGLYKSTDRGRSWRRIQPFAAYAVAVSTTDPNLVYIGSRSGPIRSNDGGVTFGAAGRGPDGDPAGTIAVDPLNPDIVYAVTFSNKLYRSTDGGAQWTPIQAGLTPLRVHTLAIHPTAPHTLYLGTLGAMYRSTDSGASWTKITLFPPSISASGYSFAISPAAPSTVYAGTERGVIRSTNGGVTWSVALQAWTAPAVAVDPANPQNVLAAVNFDLARSTNGGATFAVSNEGLTSFYTDSIAVDARFPSIVYAGGPSGFLKSSDRGSTWTRLSNARVSGTAVDPFDSSILYGLVDGRLHRSTDGGVTWPELAGGGPVPGGAIESFRLDPRNAGTIYILLDGTIHRRAGTGPWESHAGLPNGQALFLTVDPTTSALYAGGAAGLFKSVDGGVTWTPAGSGISGTVLATAVDPFDARHLFAWNFTHAVFESHDGGGSWIARPNVSAFLTFDASAQGVVYTHSSVVKRSVDGGATFQTLRSADGLVDAQRLAIAPDGKTLYAGGTASGVWTYDFGRRRATGR